MTQTPVKCGICILAGGLSARMGRDKGALRLGSKTLLTHVRAEARETGLPLRIIRRDLIARCGPLGGIFSALKTSRAEAELFLACDMPFVSAELMQQLIDASEAGQRPVFVTRKFRVPSSEFRVPSSKFSRMRVQGSRFKVLDFRAGFPFLIPVGALPVVHRQISKQEFSLQRLAKVLKARLLKPLPKQEWELFNVNTPEEWETAQQRWKEQRTDGSYRSGRGP